MDPEKEHAAQLEEKPLDQVGDGFTMPEALAALSDDEMKALGKRATWKMDLAIMPVLVISYILNYLDRSNLTISKLANIEEDLSLSAVEYQTSVSILFVGYSTSSFSHR